MPSDANFTYDGWSGSSSAGDYVIHNGTVYQAAIATTNEPGLAGSESDWNLIADYSTISALSITEQANKS